MKLPPVVNFINIYGAAFALIFLPQKITKLNCNKRKAAKILSSENVDEIDT